MLSEEENDDLLAIHTHLGDENTLKFTQLIIFPLTQKLYTRNGLYCLLRAVMIR